MLEVESGNKRPSTPGVQTRVSHVRSIHIKSASPRWLEITAISLRQFHLSPNFIFTMASKELKKLSFEEVAKVIIIGIPSCKSRKLTLSLIA